MKIVCISDVHGEWDKVTIPECDLLISAGDYSWKGEKRMVAEFHEWLHKQPAKHIISVQGNHELWVEKNFAEAQQAAYIVCPRAVFIDEGLVNVEGVSIYCSAITPFYCNWAWNRHPGADIQSHWDKIPDNVDVVVTHGPAYGILDAVRDRHTGCPQLLKRLLEVKPKLHVCGHIHEGYGDSVMHGIQFINASICNRKYEAVNQPVIFNVPERVS